MFRRSLCAALVFVVLGLCTDVAHARITRQLTWRYNQIWSTTVRYLRIDKGYPITEQDKKAGYILFEHRESGRSLNGSLELVPVEQEGKHYIRVDLRLQDMPTYVEVVMIDKLVRKLRDEHGRQPAAKLVNTGEEKGAGGEEKAEGKKQAKSKEPPDDEEEIEVSERDLEETEEE